MIESKYKRACFEALSEEYEARIPIIEEEHIFSDKFEKKMKRLIKRRRKPYYKMINTVGKRVACTIMAIFIASFATVMSVEALRNAFKDFLIWIFGKDSIIESVDTESSPEVIEDIYGITYDLSQYVIDYEEYNEISRNIIYYQEVDDIVIDFSQHTKNEFASYQNTEGADIITIDINGAEAIYFVDNNSYRNIIWDNGQYVFFISSNISENELIDIAKSVQKVEN